MLNTPLVRRLESGQEVSGSRLVGVNVNYDLLPLTITGRRVAIFTSDQPLQVLADATTLGLKASNGTDPADPFLIFQIEAGGIFMLFDISQLNYILFKVPLGSQPANVQYMIAGN